MKLCAHFGVAVLFSMWLSGWALGLTAPVFGPASAVTALNGSSTVSDVDDSISADGLIFVLDSNRAGGGRLLYEATRPNIASGFSTPTEGIFAGLDGTVSGANGVESGIISPDELQVFYTVETFNPVGSQMYEATRATTAANFGNPQALTNLQIDSSLYFPAYISADDDRFYYSNSNGQLFVTSRSNSSSAFGTPTSAPFVNFPYEEGLTMTPDELQVYAGSGSGIVWSSRSSTAVAFPTPVAVSSITVPGSNFSPIIFGNTLYFDNGGVNHIYSAVAVPEPGFGWVFMGVCFAAIYRRPVRRVG
jgi:hypothetical protein